MPARLFAHALGFIGVIVTVTSACVAVRADDTTSPSPPSPPPLITPALAKEHGFCPLWPYVRPTDLSRTRYEVTLYSLETGTTSGTLTMYAGGSRYDVPFHELATHGTGEKTWRTLPLVVRFPSPTTVDGAWVSSVDGLNGWTCRAPYDPWTSQGKQDFAFLQDPSIPTLIWQSAVRRLTPTDVPAPVLESPRCALPDQPPRTVAAVEPEYEAGAKSAVDVAVLVLIDDHDAVLAAAVAKPSGYPNLDVSAVHAATNSTFQSATFHCQKTVALYTFVVTFLP